MHETGELGVGRTINTVPLIHSRCFYSIEKEWKGRVTHLSVGLLTLGGDGVDLVDEDDGGGVLLRLLEGLNRHTSRKVGMLDACLTEIRCPIPRTCGHS